MISFDINNQGKIQLIQEKHDSNVIVKTLDSNGNVYRERVISPGDFVMLYNLYVYIRDNNIKNSFINPYGKNTCEL